MNEAIVLIKHNILKLSASEYEAVVKSQFLDAELIRDLHLSEGQRRSFTLTDRFQSERLMDGWLEVQLSNWKLVLDYGHAIEEVEFNLNNSCEKESHVFHEWT